MLSFRPAVAETLTNLRGKRPVCVYTVAVELALRAFAEATRTRGNDLEQYAAHAFQEPLSEAIIFALVLTDEGALEVASPGTHHGQVAFGSLPSEHETLLRRKVDASTKTPVLQELLKSDATSFIDMEPLNVAIGIEKGDAMPAHMRWFKYGKKGGWKNLDVYMKESFTGAPRVITRLPEGHPLQGMHAAVVGTMHLVVDVRPLRPPGVSPPRFVRATVFMALASFVAVAANPPK